MLHFSSKDLDGLCTCDQWIREKVAGNIWQKRKLRLSLVPGFTQTLGQEWPNLMLRLLYNVLMLPLLWFQLLADSWLKDVVDYQTRSQTRKLKDFVGLSFSYLGQDSSTNVSSHSLDRNSCPFSFICKLLSHTSIWRQLSSPFLRLKSSVVVSTISGWALDSDSWLRFWCYHLLAS